ncbi:MAG: phosphocarrier protein HPr [Candidatus Tyloplasma litorale]|nr:MAG: phosphocarrier protein HPr [Mycoplasmatales bacterium]
MEIKLIIKDPIGLHARPASIMVKEANKFDSDIQISIGSKSGNLKSIMSVMALGAKTGDEVIITANGSDAEAALKAIESEMLKSKVI